MNQLNHINNYNFLDECISQTRLTTQSCDTKISYPLSGGSLSVQLPSQNKKRWNDNSDLDFDPIASKTSSRYVKDDARMLGLNLKSNEFEKDNFKTNYSTNNRDHL